MLTQREDKAVDRGQKIVLVGLLIQLAFFGLFSVLVPLLHRRIRRSTTTTTNLSKIFSAMYSAIVLITIRSVFRFIEYAWQDGPWHKSEVYLYVLDAVPMVLFVLHWNIVDVGRFVGGKARKRGYGSVGVEGAELVGR
jgi:hypothetical protein